MVAEAVPKTEQTQVKRRHLTRNQRRTITFYAMVSPWLIGFILLGVFPLVVGVLTSFTNYDGLNFNSFKWVGFGNYTRGIFDDPDVLFSLKRTLVWGALNLPLWLILFFPNS